MASIINTPVTFNYTGVNGYTSTITYSRITGGTSQIQLSIDENATSNKPLGITIAITPTVLNNGVKGSPYTSVTFTATGGSSPYTFSVDSTT
jgi:hypothetical protein